MKIVLVLGFACILGGCCLGDSDCGESLDVGAALPDTSGGVNEPISGGQQPTGGGGSGGETDAGGSGGSSTGTSTGGSDTGGGTDNVSGGGGTDSGNLSNDCPEWSSQVGTRNDLPLCELTTENMSVDRTLDANHEWFLSGFVVVGSPKYKELKILDHTNVFDLRDNAVTLSINAGATIVGDTNSLLIIARGANINAIGTAQSPILFESIDEGVDGTSEWGGLVILGLAPSNECPIDGAFCNNENDRVGLSGGNDANDSSGRLSYVVITETGLRLALENSTDGLGLFSVGSGTSIDHLQVHNSGDDGISIHGGAPFMKYLVISDFFDDGLDWSDGFQGGIQYMLLHSQSLNDRGIEADNSSSDNYLDEPMSMPTISNATIVSRLASESSYGIFLSSGSGVFLSKTLFSNYDTCLRISADSTARIDEGRTVFTNVALSCRISSDSLTDPGGYTATDIEYNRLAPVGTRFSLVSQTETVFGPQISGVSGVQPGLVAPVDFFESNSYIGAVDPNATERWWDGWTIDFYEDGL